MRRGRDQQAFGAGAVRVLPTQIPMQVRGQAEHKKRKPRIHDPLLDEKEVMHRTDLWARVG